MAKLATPHLKDVAPTVTALQAVSDRLIEVGLQGAPLSAVRLTVSTEQGAVGAVLLLSVGDDNGTPYWTDLSLAIAKDCPPEVTARVNRLMNGFAVQRSGMASQALASPRIGMNWRTGHVAATYRRRSYALPILAKADVHVGSAYIMTRWNVRSTPVVMDTNVAAGFSPLAAPTKSARSSARRSAAAAKRAAKVAAMASPTVKGVTTPSVTPTGSTQKAIPTPPKAKPSVLPKDHPGIFAELARKPWTVYTEPSVQRKLQAAYNEFVNSTEGPVVIALRGPSGAGKTLAAMELAASKGLPFAKFEVQGLRDFADWYGSVSLREVNGHTVTDFVPSALTEAVRLDGPYSGIPRLVLLDEITRAETPSAQNSALGLTDNSGTVYIPDARKSIVIDPAVLIVWTANIGSMFVTAGTLDQALSNRGSSWITVDYASPSVEAKIVAEQSGVDAAIAQKIVQVATGLRGMANRGEFVGGAPSTRQLVRVGKAVVNGLSTIEAYEVGYADNAAISQEGGADSDKAKVMKHIEFSLR